MVIGLQLSSQHERREKRGRIRTLLARAVGVFFFFNIPCPRLDFFSKPPKNLIELYHQISKCHMGCHTYTSIPLPRAKVLARALEGVKRDGSNVRLKLLSCGKMSMSKDLTNVGRAKVCTASNDASQHSFCVCSLAVINNICKEKQRKSRRWCLVFYPLMHARRTNYVASSRDRILQKTKSCSLFYKPTRNTNRSHCCLHDFPLFVQKRLLYPQKTTAKTRAASIEASGRRSLPRFAAAIGSRCSCIKRLRDTHQTLYSNHPRSRMHHFNCTPSIIVLS